MTNTELFFMRFGGALVLLGFAVMLAYAYTVFILFN